MTEEEFNKLKDKGFNRVPVFRKKLADLDTPLSIYLKIANEPNTYLFESVIDGKGLVVIPLSVLNLTIHLR